MLGKLGMKLAIELAKSGHLSEMGNSLFSRLPVHVFNCSCEWMPLPLARSKIAKLNYESTTALPMLKAMLKLCISFLKHYFVVPEVFITCVRALYLYHKVLICLSSDLPIGKFLIQFTGNSPLSFCKREHVESNALNSWIF